MIRARLKLLWAKMKSISLVWTTFKTFFGKHADKMIVVAQYTGITAVAGLSVVGAVGTVKSFSNEGKISNLTETKLDTIEFTEQVTQINQAGEASVRDFTAAIQKVSDDLEAEAALLDGRLQQTFLTASENLQATATELENSDVVTNENLADAEATAQDNLTLVEEALIASDLSNKNELIANINSITIDITNLELENELIKGTLTTTNQSIADLEAQDTVLNNKIFSNDITASNAESIANSGQVQISALQTTVNALPGEFRLGTGTISAIGAASGNSVISFSSPFTKCTLPVVVFSTQEIVGQELVISNVSVVTNSSFTALIRSANGINFLGNITYYYIAACPI